MEQIDVWQVLDRINAVVQHSILTNPSLLQGPESSLVSGLVTVKLGMYEESCGYTKEVSNELFSRKNERKRELLGRHGRILFENVNQVWDRKKITLSTCASNRSYIPWSELYEQQSTPSTSTPRPWRVAQVETRER
jgi:hypothetical protein